MSNAQASPASREDRGERRYVLGGHPIDVGKIAPGLHIVATPIGNLGDITLRALATLAGADLIACEDTRVTRKLLDRYAIATPLTPYHDHNAATARPKLLRRLAEGAAIALVSDAGTPLVSDPGFKLVRAAQEAGHMVTALPGPSALLAALAVAGLPTDQFFFGGFLPAKQAARRARIAELARIPSTLVLFETGPRIAATLADLAAGLGRREAALCRELTKIHEEIRRGDLETSGAKLRYERSSRRNRPRHRATASAGSAERRRHGCAAAAGARPRFAQGCRGRSGGGDRAAAPGPLPAGARAGEGRKPGHEPGNQTWRAALSQSQPRRERVAAFPLGLSAESRAAMFLTAKGYRIAARRRKTPFGEIDIVARRRRALVFVEVKARDRAEEAAEAVTERSKRRIVAAAELWLAYDPDDNERDIRFDVMLVAPGRLPQHIANAFDASR